MYKITFLIFFLSLSFLSKAQDIVADQILGEWLNEEKDMRIEIYKNGSEYLGKLMWAQNYFEADGKTFRKDISNTDKSLRTRSLHNIDILHDFTFTEDIWDNGKMYDPKSGKTYNCLMKFKDETLEIRSYVGIPLFGRSTYWKRSL
ncbi:MAG: DUF2147 domain-containing protein [Dyadobacter sp.]|uniref:DUF2147 domain-containing protein n=1 Tax=Dyadobacter sp. TaxID=1914288 RepID=UPI003263C65B